MLSGSRWTFKECVFVCLAFAFMGGLCLGSMRSQAVTIDEFVDIPSGLAYWQKQDTRLNPEHPPLLKMVSAVPLLFAHVRADYDDASWCGNGKWGDCEWVFGRKFFEQWNPHPQHLLVLARLPMVAVTLFLALVVFYFARLLAGPWGGAVSLILFVTSPFFLAFGPLVVTDIGLPLFVLGSVWTFASLWSNPNGKNLTSFALCTAGACLTKFSALLLLPIFVVSWAYFRFNSRHEVSSKDQHATADRSLWRNSASEWYVLSGIALSIVLVSLFYVLTCWRTDPARIFAERAAWFGSRTFAGNLVTHIGWFLPKHPLLASWFKPFWLYLLGVLDVAFRSDRPTFVLGKWHAHGVWFYFPTVSFFKLAPAMIGCFALLALFVGVYLFRAPSARAALVPDAYRHHLEALVVAWFIFVGVTMGSHLNVGVRHFSVPIAIGTILCALVVPLAKVTLPAGFPRVAGAYACGTLAVSALATAIVAYPHYISYFNFFRFGIPKQDIAVSSNLYWGQSLIDLERFREQHHIFKIYVDGRTSRIKPAIYIPGAEEWHCDEPDPAAPEWVAVAANFLVNQPPTCAGLFRYSHWYVSDQSMVVFHVTDSQYAVERASYLREHPEMHLTVLGAMEKQTPSHALLDRPFDPGSN